MLGQLTTKPLNLKGSDCEGSVRVAFLSQNFTLTFCTVFIFHLESFQIITIFLYISVFAIEKLYYNSLIFYFNCNLIYLFLICNYFFKKIN